MTLVRYAYYRPPVHIQSLFFCLAVVIGPSALACDERLQVRRLHHHPIGAFLSHHQHCRSLLSRRWIGDMAHLLSFLVLLFKVHGSRSCAGISLKTQELYALVFITRYLDLFWNFYSMYNSIMKVRPCVTRSCCAAALLLMLRGRLRSQGCAPLFQWCK